MTAPTICDACLLRPVFGIFQLRDEDGHLVAAWWTCCECADHDAPIHYARGLRVSVAVDLADGWQPL